MEDFFGDPADIHPSWIQVTFPPVSDRWYEYEVEDNIKSGQNLGQYYTKSAVYLA